MSRCSGFPEAFVHAALFCFPAHTVFGSPSPGHGKEDRCIVLPTGTNKAPGIHERQWPGRAFGSVCWVYHKLYLSRAFCREHPAWIAVYGGFARFVGRRRCSFGRRAAVRIAAAGNCAQGISQLASVAGRSPQKEKGSLIRLPLLLTICSFDLTRKPN